MSVYRINKTRLAELVDKTITKVVPSDLEYSNIGDYAFQGCSSLTSITFNSLTRIGYRAFSGCSNLTSITIPSSITSIVTYAFQGCSSLTEMTVLATTPPTLNSNVFSNSGITATTGKIYVPLLSVTAYKEATNWSVYADIIVGGTPI